MNTRLYALIAIVVCVIAIWLFNKLNDKGVFKSNATFRYTASFFVGGFWILLVPAIIIEYIIYQCCWHFSLIDWHDVWETLKDAVKGWFKRKE